MFSCHVSPELNCGLLRHVSLNPRNLSSDVPRAHERQAETRWEGERASHLTGKTTNVKTEMISGEFLKSGSGEYLTGRRGKVKICIWSHRTLAGAITRHKYATA